MQIDATNEQLLTDLMTDLCITDVNVLLPILVNSFRRNMNNVKTIDDKMLEELLDEEERSHEKK